jgi:hypothetical protein
MLKPAASGKLALLQRFRREKNAWRRWNSPSFSR